jgi:MFS family permease
LTEILGFDLTLAGILCIVPYACLFVTTILTGEGYRILLSTYDWKTRQIRQLSQLTAFLGSCTMLMILAYTDNKYGGLVLIIIAQSFLSGSNSGLSCSYLDLAPKFSGNYNSVGNMIGAIAGLLGPIVVAQCTEAWPGIEGWRIVFIITTLLSISASIIWYLYQSSEIDVTLNSPAKAEI